MKRLFASIVAGIAITMSTSAFAQGAREITYSPHTIVQLRAKLRFTTMVILPEQEEILDFVCGDKEFWIVSGGQNLAYIKPAKAGVTTNLNLVTATGHVYSFILSEGGEPDLKVFVKSDETTTPPQTNAQRFFTATQVENLRHEIDDARKDADDARKQLDALRASTTKSVEDRVSAFRATLPATLQFPYRFKANQKPFNVSAIYTDGRFTYIRADAPELPALYETIDAGPGSAKSPNLINFQVENGLYIVPKVLESGYLAIGKQKLVFQAVR